MKLCHLKKYSEIVIVGYGLEGKSREKFLQKELPNTRVTILDPVKIPISPTENTGYIISPGISRQDLCQNILPQNCTSNTELFFSNVETKNLQKVIGITGTKGKSTTTKFLSECLLEHKKKVLIGGNYGQPLLDLFDSINHADFLVAELSSYQLEFLTISPSKTIFLNIFADHLDRHKTLKNYTKIKCYFIDITICE